MSAIAIRMPLEVAYQRKVLLAVELLDAVTLARVTQGAEVEARGLKGAPIVNTSGLFVWLNEDTGDFRGLAIDPGRLPYEPVTLEAVDVRFPLTVVELSPRADYLFDFGFTALRGRLVVQRVPPEPARDGIVNLDWLDVNGAWARSNALSKTSAMGDFAVALRLGPADEPKLTNGLLTLRLRARRSGGERISAAFDVPPGRVTEPSILDPRIFAWDELNP